MRGQSYRMAKGKTVRRPVLLQIDLRTAGPCRATP